MDDKAQGSLQYGAGKAWPEYLSQYPWHHAVTLTFRVSPSSNSPDRRSECLMEVSSERASRCFEIYAERLSDIYERIWFAYVIERGSRGAIHIHAVLGGTERIPMWKIKEAWTYGFVRIAKSPGLGFLRYMTKDLAYGSSEVVLHPRLKYQVRRWRHHQRLGG